MTFCFAFARCLCRNVAILLDTKPIDGDHSFVRNHAYTNVIAGYAIFFAKYAECLCNGSMTPIPKNWEAVAKSLKLPYDPGAKYHPEFEGYVQGEFIKQADAVLLGFPLLYQMDPEIRKNDLTIYEKVTRNNGPAMTWAMHAVGLLEIDEVAKAEALFNRSYQSYSVSPFNVSGCWGWI